MTNYGITKGTKLENIIENMRKGEADGASMYSALSYIAKEKGLEELSDKLMQIAVDELRHAGIYALLNGQVNDNIFDMLKKMAPVEINAEEKLKELAASIKDLGLESASKEVESIALDEGNHGKELEKLIKDFC